MPYWINFYFVTAFVCFTVVGITWANDYPFAALCWAMALGANATRWHVETFERDED